MRCNDSCDYFVDGERAYCSMSGLAVSEGMSCIEGKSGKKERYSSLEKMYGQAPSKAKPTKKNK